MQEPADNRDVAPGGAGPRSHPCTSCGHVDSPISVGPGPGWIAILLWAAAAVLWGLGMVLGATWLMFPTAAVFLAALLYTLWYFYRRERACRHCGAPWVGTGGDATG